MARKLSVAAAFTFLGVCSFALRAQGSSITLAAVNGRNGKAMPHQRLLVFMGSSQDEVRFHKLSADVTTDEHGRAVLQIPPGSVQWVQVFADSQTLCQSEPNNRSFSLENVLSSGVSTPNNCGLFLQEPKPGQLTVFSRPPTFREKMAW